MSVSAARSGWYELRPFFELVDDKYVDMHEIVKRIKGLSFFIVRSADGMIRLFMHLPDPSDPKMAQGLLRNALMEPTGRKAFSAGAVTYLKTRKHYAIPVTHEQTAPLLYATMEKIDRACFVAVSAKYSGVLSDITFCRKEHVRQAAAVERYSSDVPLRHKYGKSKETHICRKADACRAGEGKAETAPYPLLHCNRLQ